MSEHKVGDRRYFLEKMVMVVGQSSPSGSGQIEVAWWGPDGSLVTEYVPPDCLHKQPAVIGDVVR